MISEIKELREETYDLKVDSSTLQKQFDSLNVEFDNITYYEHEDGLLISGAIISNGTHAENC